MQQTNKKNNNCLAKTIAPAKVILSGEYSIIYNKPVLAVAVKKYVNVNVFENVISGQNKIFINLENINHCASKTLSEIYQLVTTMDAAYENNNCFFLSKLENKNHVVDVFFYALGYFFTLYKIHKTSMLVDISSQIPIGSGMGSSAATITCFLFALHQVFDIPYSKEELAQNASFIERFLHTCISRIDSKVITYGGLINIKNNTLYQFDACFEKHWYIINTGTPTSTTGECVKHVQSRFSSHNSIWSEFENITSELEIGLKTKNYKLITGAIAANQNKLEHLGVVPKKLAYFIHNIKNNFDIYAKITGAGSIKGNCAGTVVAFCKNNLQSIHQLQIMCDEYGYSFSPLITDARGVRKNVY